MCVSKYLLVIGAFTFLLDYSSAKPHTKSRISDAKSKTKKISKHIEKKAKIHDAVVKQVEPDNAVCQTSLARRLESEWKLLDMQISHITRRMLTISREVSVQNNSFSSNVVGLSDKKGSKETIVVSRCKNLVEQRYKKLANNCHELKSFQTKLDGLKLKQKDVERKIEDLLVKLRQSSKIADPNSQLIKDTMFDISKKASCIEDLFSKVNLELQAGAFSRFVKCRSFAPKDYPVEAIFVDKEIKTLDKYHKLIVCDITARSGACVMSPYFGTVIFSSNVPSLGNTVIISNSEANVMICGINEVFCSVGSVVRYGQVIGALSKENLDDEYSLLKYAILMKL